MNNNALVPHCQVAYAFADTEIRGEAMSIEFLRACVEFTPTWPHIWTVQEGSDFAAAFCGR